MRALIVTNMWPSPERPALGVFVRDQVDALRALGADVEVWRYRSGGLAYARAWAQARRRRPEGWDVVHAHFGLSALPALGLRGAPRVVTLHGTDLVHPASGPASRLLLRAMDLPATVSATLAGRVPGAGVRRRVAVLPCGVDLGRFRPRPRADARRALGLDPGGRLLLLPADPARAVKRADRARELAAAAGLELASLGATPPEEMPLWLNAADAVCVPSDEEGFGLAVLEALACDVPVLATPRGVAPLALQGVAGTLCAEWDLEAWSGALAAVLADEDPRVAGRTRAGLFGAERMAERVLVAWEELAGPSSTGVIPGRA